MSKSILDKFEATSKAKQKVQGQWSALTAEQQSLVCRIAGIVCLFIGMMAFVLFIRSLTV